MDCIACKKPEQKDLIFETKFWKIILAAEQAYLGRTFVVLKRHCATLSELKQEEWLDFIDITKKLESLFKKTFNATMFNWTCLMNNAYQENPPDPHVHWHFRPRYKSDITIAEYKFQDLEFGNHYSTERKREITPKLQKIILQKIKANL